MKIEMLRIAAGPNGRYMRGKTYQVPGEMPQDFAEQLLKTEPPSARVVGDDDGRLEAAATRGARKRERA